MATPHQARRRDRPGAAERAAMAACRAARRTQEDELKRRAAVDAALAAARSSLAWIEEAANAVADARVQFGDSQFGLSGHVLGAPEKRAALQSTISSMETQRGDILAALALAEAEIEQARARLQFLQSRKGAVPPTK